MDRSDTMAHDVVEEFRATGKELIEKAREILEEGNVRRMIIENSRGETLLEVPLTLGVVGVGGAFALAPIISTIAAFAFLVHDARILVERYPHEYKKHSRSHLENELSDDEDRDDDPGGRMFGTHKDGHRRPSERTEHDDHSGRGERAGRGSRHKRQGSHKGNHGHDPYEIDADFEVLG